MGSTIAAQRHSVLIGSLWMVGLGILLGWIPVAGPAIAGFVGGRKAGTAGRGAVAAILPAVLLGVIVGVVLSLFDLPLLGTVAGLGTAIWAAVQAIPLIVAGALGGWTEEASTSA